jgi:ABC-type lipoprotein release transport system permease subunit
MKGVMIGWDHQAKTDMTNYEIGGGQFWHKSYDPFDPFTLTDSHAPIPAELKDEITAGDIEPFLIAPGTIYPRGRLQSIVIKGINPRQSLFLIPSHKLDTITEAIPAIIGSLMAKSIKASVGDQMTLRWRDANGTFDAGDIVITEIFSTNVLTVESGQYIFRLKTSDDDDAGRATICFQDSEKSDRH